MRKIKRSILRKQAEDKKIKASKWVNLMWNTMQVKVYGVNKRLANQARGTHKKSTWRIRVGGVVG